MQRSCASDLRLGYRSCNQAAAEVVLGNRQETLSRCVGGWFEEVVELGVGNVRGKSLRYGVAVEQHFWGSSTSTRGIDRNGYLAFDA